MSEDWEVTDRLKECVAGFQDTHFSVRPVKPFPPVFTGIHLHEFMGVVTISGRDLGLLKYMDAQADMGLEESLVVGSEVLKIDGQAPSYWIERYSKFISGSSPEFIRQNAVESILKRSFDYPSRPYVDLEIDTPEWGVRNIRLPWWTSSNRMFSRDARIALTNKGFKSTDLVKWEYSKEDQKWIARASQDVLNYEGYDLSLPLIPSGDWDALRTYKDDEDEIAARMGQVISDAGQPYCYFQLLTFNTENLKSADGTSRPFLDPIRDFIKVCKSKNLDLVIDLKQNGGGNGNFPPKILAMLTEKGKVYPGRAASFRTTRATGLLLSDMMGSSDANLRDFDEFNDTQTLYDGWVEARKLGERVTPIFPSRPIKADSKVGGYSGKVVAVVTPECVSACDVTAALLKRSGRATIVGTHSNGTGAGFRSTDTYDSHWKDPYGMIQVEIPNYLFGVLKQVTWDHELNYRSFEDEILLENMPTIADVQYEESSLDIGNPNGGGFLDVVLEQVFSQPVASPSPEPSSEPSPMASTEAVRLLF